MLRVVEDRKPPADAATAHTIYSEIRRKRAWKFTAVAGTEAVNTSGAGD